MLRRDAEGAPSTVTTRPDIELFTITYMLHRTVGSDEKNPRFGGAGGHAVILHRRSAVGPSGKGPDMALHGGLLSCASR